MAAKLEGIFTPTLVPLDERGEINEAELRRFLNWLIEKGIHGLYPNGSTGEFTRFTAEERKRIAQITCDVARGRVPVLAGAAEANIRETIKACETYAGFGARAVAIVSPIYYRLGPDAVYMYFKEIAENSPIDVTLYNIPLFASPIDLNTIRKLSELPRIVGIKDSSGDVAFMLRMVSAIRPNRPDFTFMTGWDVVLAPMMLVGADGGTNASSNVVPEMMVEIYRLCKSGQFQQAMALQPRIQELFDLMLNNYEFPDGFRAGAEARGFKMSHTRVPLTQRQHSDKSALNEVLQCLMSETGFAAPPAAGCAPRTGRASDDKVSQIVFEVMHELERRGVV
jgi:4-hydroxy-tetrahydrodipicolinate synthase